MRDTPLVGPKLTGDGGKSYGRSWTRSRPQLFDDFVGLTEQRSRNREAQSLSGL
jgi:hypothetical protein